MENISETCRKIESNKGLLCMNSALSHFPKYTPEKFQGFFLNLAVTLFTFALLTFGVSAFSAEYRVKGTILSTMHDAHGKSVTNSICLFTWAEKGEEWRVDVLEPDTNHMSGVWHSVLPFGRENLVSIRSYAAQPQVSTNHKGNAFVQVLTNKVVTMENIHGLGAVWMAFKISDIYSNSMPSGRISAFWSWDPFIKDLNYKSHVLIKTNDGFVINNRGYQYVRDGKTGKVVHHNGVPEETPMPPPGDRGFMEAALRFSKERLNSAPDIPKSIAFTHFIAMHDTSQPNGIGYITNVNILISCETVEIGQVPDELFDARWTNHSAVVVDRRATNVWNQPVNYTTKKKTLSVSDLDLVLRKEENDKRLAKAQATNLIPRDELKTVIVLLILAIPSALFVFFYRRHIASRE